MNMYARYKTDPVAEEEGQDVAFADGLVIRVRSVRSKKIRDLQGRIAKRNQRYYRGGGTVPTEVQDADNIELAAAIIATWRGATDVEGKTLPFSPAAARQVMADLVDLRDQVIAAAASSDTFRDGEDIQAATENLSSASAASSSSAAPGAQGS